MNDWLHSGMEQDARRLEVWMPNMNDSNEVNEFRGKLRKFLAGHPVTQKEVAGKIGVSGTTLNLFLNGTYKGDCEKLAKKLVDYINKYERRSRTDTGGGYVETTITKAILTVIRTTETYSQPQEGRISLIVGDAGHGKSVCLQEYAKSHSNTVYVKLRTSISSKDMFGRIAEAMGLDQNATLPRLMEDVGGHLKKREQTLLLDEASGLDVKRLDLLRQIITESGSTLILAGNSHLLHTIIASVGRQGYESMDQFRSRMLTVLNLDEAADGKDGGGLYTVADIRKLYEYGGLKLTADGADTLKRICRTPQTGRLRTCSIVIAAIHNSDEVRNGKIQTIDAAVIRKAIILLGLPVAGRLPMVMARADKEEQDAAAAKTA